MGLNAPNFANNKGQSEDVSQLSFKIKRFVDWFNRFPLANNQVIENVVLTTTKKNIAHGLKRPPIGYLVINKNANANVYTVNPTSTTPNDGMRSDYCTLISSATVTVTLMFF